MDLLDISHHNPITDWADVPLLPIVHKVNEGTAIDRTVRDRMPHIEARSKLFGGYTVLIVSGSSIRKQLETYASVMEPWWRDGCFTQLDIEPWERYSRPVSTAEIVEAGEVHDELFGPGRFTAYINPNQLPKQYAELSASGWLKDRLWLPNYSSDGRNQAIKRGAVIHQFTSRAQVSGFQYGIDANTVHNWDALNRIANISSAPVVDRPEVLPTTPPSEEDDMPVKTLWCAGNPDTDPVYCVEDGVHISGPVRKAWRELADAGKLTLVEVDGDPHKGIKASLEYQAGKRKDAAPVVNVEVPAVTFPTYVPRDS